MNDLTDKSLERVDRQDEAITINTSKLLSQRVGASIEGGDEGRKAVSQQWNGQLRKAKASKSPPLIHRKHWLQSVQGERREQEPASNSGNETSGSDRVSTGSEESRNVANSQRLELRLPRTAIRIGDDALVSDSNRTSASLS